MMWISYRKDKVCQASLLWCCPFLSYHKYSMGRGIKCPMSSIDKDLHLHLYIYSWLRSRDSIATLKPLIVQLTLSLFRDLGLIARQLISVCYADCSRHEILLTAHACLPHRISMPCLSGVLGQRAQQLWKASAPIWTSLATVLALIVCTLFLVTHTLATIHSYQGQSVIGS